MLIPYKAVYALLERYTVPKSLEGIINDCIGSFEESIETAHSIEDYNYLFNLVEKREENETKFRFFWDYKLSIPIVLEVNKDLTIPALSKIAFDVQKVPEGEFIQLIETICERNHIDSTQPIEIFRLVLERRKNMFRLNIEPSKIERNEQCPCGSGKKYKNCHGRPD